MVPPWRPPRRNIVAHPRHSTHLDEAFHFTENSQKMQGISISQEAAYVLVQECTKLGDLESGKRVQFLIGLGGLASNACLSDHFIRLFTSCGSLDQAIQAFIKVLRPSQCTWNAIIDAHAKLGDCGTVLHLYERMEESGKKADKFTFPGVLKACSSIGLIEQGRRIHEQIIQSGLQSDIVVGSTIVHMYSKCGSLKEAQSVFDKLENLDVVAWGAMIAAYVQHNEGHLALKCFQSMQCQGIMPDKFTFSSILKACGSIGSLDQGKDIHKQILENKLESDIVVGSALVDMYVKFGNLEEAWSVFITLPCRNVITWNSMILGYAELGEGYLALQCFENMRMEKITPTKVTFLSVLKACGNVGAIEQGRSIHEQIADDKFQHDSVLGNALVDMYAKCGSLAEARNVFDKMPNRSVVSWGTIITGYAQLGEAGPAMQSLLDMQHDGVKPNAIIFTGILTAINRLGLVDEGIFYFKSMSQYGAHQAHNIFHVTCLVDLLGRAACVNEAENLLKTTLHPDICLWTTLLTSCKIHCNVQLARKCFDEILRLDHFCSGAYVLMSDVYAGAHMIKSAYKIELLRRYVDEHHPGIDKVYAMLENIMTGQE